MFTHDSIGLGEDGPTPVHRACGQPAPDTQPGRVAPCRHGGNRRGLGVALSNRTKPTALALSRQNLQHLSAAAPKRVLGDISRGAYVLSEPADVGIKKKPRP